MRSMEELKKTLNKINVKIQLAPKEITGWDIIKLYSDYPNRELNEYAQSLKKKLPQSVLTSPQLVRDIADFLISPDLNIRALAKKILKEINNDQTKSFLSPKALNLRWLTSPDLDPYLLAEAARYLGAIGEKSSVEPLIKVMNHPHKAVRGSAAVALGNIGDQRAVPILLKALEDDELYVKEKAAAALLNFPVEDCIKPLIKAYKAISDGSEVTEIRLRKHCTQVLLKIGLPSAAALTNIMRNEKKPTIRVWAMTLLLIMGVLPIQEFISLARENIIDKHIELTQLLLRDIHTDATPFKDYFLPLINFTGNLDFLKIIVYAKDRELKKLSLERIYQLDVQVFDDIFAEVLLCNWPTDKNLFLDLGDKIIPTIMHLLASYGPHIRVGCLQLLGEMGNLKGMKIIEEHLRDCNSEVRKEALLVILKIKNQGNVEIPVICVNELINLIGTDMEKQAISELKKISQFTVDFIQEEIRNQDEDLLIKMISVLEILGGEKALRLLARIWRLNRDNKAGSKADEVLNRFGRKSTLSRLFIR